jgi:renalase
MSGKRVAIVGAGISGLSAAKQFLEGGWFVTLFDKGRSVGGRCATKRVNVQDTPVTFDHGAQYFTASTPEFESAVTEWVDKGVSKLWHGKITAFNATTGQIIDKSHDNMKRYIGAPGNSAIPKYQASSLRDTFDHHIELHVNSTVTQLKKDDQEKWMVITSSEEISQNISYDAVVISVPPEQALSLIQNHSSLIAQYLNRVSMYPCWALMLVFENKITVETDGSFVNEHDSLTWICRNSSKNDQNYDCWVVHASYTWSEKHLEQDAQSVANELFEHFKQVVEKLGGNVSEPLFKAAHRWKHTTVRSKHAQLGEKYLCDDENNLAIVGDYCGGSKIEGAFMSGLSCARYMISH